MWSTTERPPSGQKSYVRQLVDAFALLAVGLGLAVPLILFWTAWQQARLFSLHTAEELAAILAEDARYALLVHSRPDAQALVNSLLKFPDLIQVRLLDAEGQVVAEQSTAGHGQAKRTARVETPVLAEDRRPSASLDAGTPDPETPLGVLTLLLGLAVAYRSLRMLAPLGTLVRRLGDPLETALPNPPAASPAEVHRLYAAVTTLRAHLAENHRQLEVHAEELEAKVAARTQDLRTARDAAEQANRAKTLFLANVSHELRTPLQAIILHARLLERHKTGPGTESLAVILRASNQLLELIEQVLNLTKVESGHPIEVTYQRFVLGALLKEVVTTLEPTLSPRNRLELTRPEADVTLISDRARLTQVLYNLIRNADKFTDGGVIQLRLKPSHDGEQAIIQVTDQGIGIQPAEQERIFEPLYQGFSGIAGAVSSGIGLGLWLSRRMVETLGGRLTVTSEPGVGSCFRVDLPVKPTATVGLSVAHQPLELELKPSRSEPTPAETAPHRGQRLLLAEDEDSIRAPLARFLREAGFSVDACADGTSAQALLLQSPNTYAAVILDHRMPGCLGLDILAWLRASNQQNSPPVVILTGDDRAPLQAAITRLGAHLMVKPVLPERLIGTIVTLIEQSAQADRGTLR
ncbi:ATP-binding response regulator [Thiocystis violascens]|uniref:histidine kinase n=1 Tax=Thiocystis violascens (strain ATCC 17096 / DSM 198 / 6111) TaxID=765911 RepID=I3Y8X5_THIV6|nr:hybrid sensor histidine kinase/response regulator [Thiocystis violascens]AFL73443.1 signal transduction histidine kinase [Thiocystis violascens DSM 198]